MIDKPLILDSPSVTSYSAFKAELKTILAKNKNIPKNSKYMEMVIHPRELEQKNLAVYHKIIDKSTKFDPKEIIKQYELQKIQEISQKKENAILEKIDERLKTQILDLCSQVSEDQLEVEDIKIKDTISFEPENSESIIFDNQILKDIHTYLSSRQSPVEFLETQFLTILMSRFAEKSGGDHGSVRKTQYNLPLRQSDLIVRSQNETSVADRNLATKSTAVRKGPAITAETHHPDERNLSLSKNERTNEMYYNVSQNNVGASSGASQKSDKVSDKALVNSVSESSASKTDDIILWEAIRNLVKQRYSRITSADSFEGNFLYAELYLSFRTGLKTLAQLIISTHSEFFDRTCQGFILAFREFTLSAKSEFARILLSKDTPTDEFRTLLLKIFSYGDLIIEGQVLFTTEDFIWANLHTNVSKSTLSDVLFHSEDVPVSNKILSLFLLGNYSLASHMILTSGFTINSTYHILKALCTKTPCLESHRNLSICVFYILKNIFASVDDRIGFFRSALPFLNREVVLRVVPELLVKYRIYDILLHDEFPQEILRETINLMKKTGESKGLIQIGNILDQETLEQALLSEMLSLVTCGDIESFLVANEKLLVRSAGNILIKELLNLLVFKNNPTYINLQKTLFARNRLVSQHFIAIRPAIESLSNLATNIALQSGEYPFAAHISSMVDKVRNLTVQ